MRSKKNLIITACIYQGLEPPSIPIPKLKFRQKSKIRHLLHICYFFLLIYHFQKTSLKKQDQIEEQTRTHHPKPWHIPPVRTTTVKKLVNASTSLQNKSRQDFFYIKTLKNPKKSAPQSFILSTPSISKTNLPSNPLPSLLPHHILENPPPHILPRDRIPDRRFLFLADPHFLLLSFFLRLAYRRPVHVKTRPDNHHAPHSSLAFFPLHFVPEELLHVALVVVRFCEEDVVEGAEEYGNVARAGGDAGG